MTVAEVLAAARALYEANPSHVRLVQPVPDGCFCPITAIYHVTDHDEALTPAHQFRARADLTEQALNTFTGCTNRFAYEGVPTWNARVDTPTVLAAFDRAIAEATT